MGMYRSLGLNFSNFSHHLTTPVLLINTSHTSHTSHSPLTTRWHQEREQELQAIATEDITISVRRKEHHARVVVIPSMHDGKDRFVSVLWRKDGYIYCKFCLSPREILRAEPKGQTKQQILCHSTLCILTNYPQKAETEKKKGNLVGLEFWSTFFQLNTKHPFVQLNGCNYTTARSQSWFMAHLELLT